MQRMIFPVLAASVLGLALTACDRPQEGPAEKAGKKIDQGIEQTKEAIGDTADKMGEKIEEAGDTIRDKTDQ